MWSEGTVELRPARAEEAGIVRDLAALDDAPALEGQVLLALIDGRAVAGLSLDDGRVVANPFVPTVEVVAVLRMRAEQLSVVPRRRRLSRGGLSRHSSLAIGSAPVRITTRARSGS